MIDFPSFLEILEAKASGNKGILNEKSLQRVYHHSAVKKSFGIVTSYRAGNTNKVNQESFKELQNSIRSAGLGYNKLVGHWRESQNPDKSYEDADESELIDSKEQALFIPGISLDLIKGLASKYNQDAFVYAGPETEGKVSLVFRDGKMQKLGEFSPHKIAQAYSSLRGKNFVFEGFEYIAQSYFESLTEQAYKAIK